MPDQPVIFLSAVSRELKSARQHVADVLESLGIGVEVQDIFNVPTGDLRSVLREKIDRCHGLIHFVGQHYGYEPQAHDDPSDPCSYTQLEARYARASGLKVWYLLLDKAYPPENPSADSEDGAALQQAWRVRVRKLGHVYENVADRKDVENKALRIAHEVNRTFGVAPNADDKFAQLAAKVEQALAQLPQARSEAAQGMAAEDPATIEARAYATLEKKLGLGEGVLAKKLPQLAEKLLQSPDTSPLERARALYAEKKYAEAEAAALEAKAQLLAAPAFAASDVIAALVLAGDCAKAQFHYPQAITHFRAATVLTDRARDPVEWAAIAHDLGRVLEEDGQYSEAEELLRAVVEVRQRALGEEHPDTLWSRNNLAIVLHPKGKHVEAEQEHRAVLTLRERLLGGGHSDVAQSCFNLAGVFIAQDKYEEAQKYG